MKIVGAVLLARRELPYDGSIGKWPMAVLLQN